MLPIRLILTIGLLISAATGWGQTYSETPADTVYLKNGKVATVHIKRIEEAPECCLLVPPLHIMAIRE